jgi:hypothetical protein
MNKADLFAPSISDLDSLIKPCRLENDLSMIIEEPSTSCTLVLWRGMLNDTSIEDSR